MVVPSWFARSHTSAPNRVVTERSRIELKQERLVLGSSAAVDKASGGGVGRSR